MSERQETIADIIAKKRKYADEIERMAQECIARSERVPGAYQSGIVYNIRSEADRLEAAHKREAQSIERIVRDAIIDYNEMYPSAPNDEAERDLRERAARANAWLKQHGFEEEPFHWSEEETPCL